MEPVKPITDSQPQAGGLVPDLVSNIPIKTQGGPAKPANEDDELDQIMRDVSHDLKQPVKQPEKKHFDLFHHKPKPAKHDVKLSAQPIEKMAVTPPAAKPAEPAHRPKPVAAAPAKPTSKPVAVPKPAKTSSAPVLIITLTIIVTGALIAAAVYAYK